MRLPLLGFLILPVAELYLLFTLAAQIGGFNTLLVVIVTAILGVSVMRRQGLNSMSRMTQRMQQGQSPAPELLNGMLLSFAGLMLILPGLITDSIGILMLIPLVRHGITRRIISRGAGSMGAGVFMGGFSRGEGFGRPDQGDIIDGEVVDRDRSRPDQLHDDQLRGDKDNNQN